MEKWQGKLAVVTGASAGIGQAILEALAKNGINVIGLARRVEKIEVRNLCFSDRFKKFLQCCIKLYSHSFK